MREKRKFGAEIRITRRLVKEGGGVISGNKASSIICAPLYSLSVLLGSNCTCTSQISW